MKRYIIMVQHTNQNLSRPLPLFLSLPINLPTLCIPQVFPCFHIYCAQENSNEFQYYKYVFQE